MRVNFGKKNGAQISLSVFTLAQSQWGVLSWINSTRDLCDLGAPLSRLVRLIWKSREDEAARYVCVNRSYASALNGTSDRSVYVSLCPFFGNSTRSPSTFGRSLGSSPPPTRHGPTLCVWMNVSGTGGPLTRVLTLPSREVEKERYAHCLSRDEAARTWACGYAFSLYRAHIAPFGPGARARLRQRGGWI